jgi:hypothetical protein
MGDAIQVKDGKTVKNTGSTDHDPTEKTITPMVGTLNLFIDIILERIFLRAISK